MPVYYCLRELVIQTMLRSKNKNDLWLLWMKGNDTAVGAIFGFVKPFDLSGLGVNAFNVIAVEVRSCGVMSRIINEPMAIGRPNTRVGEDVTASFARDLSFRTCGSAGESWSISAICHEGDS